jgi:hypothetical protein
MEIETYAPNKIRMVKVISSKIKALLISKRLDLSFGYSVVEGEYTILDRNGNLSLKKKDELEFIHEKEENKELKIFLLELLLKNVN